MADSLTPAEAFAKAVTIAGGQSAAGRIVGVTQGAIWLRLKAKKPCADSWALKLEQATGVSKHDLCPDIYPRTESPAPIAAGFEHAR